MNKVENINKYILFFNITIKSLDAKTKIEYVISINKKLLEIKSFFIYKVNIIDFIKFSCCVNRLHNETVKCDVMLLLKIDIT